VYPLKKKYMLLSLCLCAALLLVSACGGPAAPSAPAEPSSAAPSQESSSGAEPSQPQEPSSASQEEAAAVVPETVPDDPTELTVPLQMTAPEKEVYLSGKPEFSTQEDADACRQWLYSLKAGDITAMYGNIFPLDPYQTVELSMEDSRKIVDLLRSIAPGLSPLPEDRDPPTGGSWTIAVYLGEEAAKLSFNGVWVSFLRQEQAYFLDVDGTSAQESCYQIETILEKYASASASPASDAPSPSPAPVTETYFPSDVQAIYALDKEAYVMAKVEDGYAASKTIWEGLENRVPSGGEPTGYGFLIFTQEGREYVYLEDSDEDLALNQACQAALNGGPLHPSWLIHMTPERMVSAKGNTIDGDVEYSTQEELQALARFLKEEVRVEGKGSVTSGPVIFDAPGGAFDLWITFDSGVIYHLYSYESAPLILHTSDLGQYVFYDIEEGMASKIWTYLHDNK